MNAACRRTASAAPLIGLLTLAAIAPATGSASASASASAASAAGAASTSAASATEAAPAAARGVGAPRAVASTAIAGGAVDLAPGGAAYRTLRRAGVAVTALGAAERHGARIVLPVAGGVAGRASELRAGVADGFALRRGRRTVRVTGLRVRLAVTGSRVTGRIGGRRSQTLFTLGWRSLRIDGDAATARATKAPWRLSVSAAHALRRELGVSALRPGVLAHSTVAVRLAGGAASVAAPAAPAAPDATAAYALEWGLRESFRKYIVGGSIETSDAPRSRRRGRIGSRW